MLLTPSAPDYWDANFVRVEGGHRGLDAGALMGAADELLAGLRHRKVEVEDEALGGPLRAHFAAAGWTADRLAVMRREGPGRSDAGVEEVALALTRPLRIEWYLSYEEDAGAQERVATAQELLGARRGMRAFVVRGGGQPVGYAHLAVPPGADAVEIEQLYVTPPARGLGLGTRLVEAALAAGGRDVAWVVADDEDRARHLYARLGFETVWRQHTFVRQPGA